MLPIPEVDTVSREDWGALPPLMEEPLPQPARHVFLTFTDTRECFTREECIQVMKEIQQRDMDSGLPDIRYNMLMGGDVSLYEGRGWTTMARKPEKCYSDFNDKTFDIAYIGPHPKHHSKNYPSVDVRLMKNDIIYYGIVNGYIDSGHNVLPQEEYLLKREQAWATLRENI